MGTEHKEAEMTDYESLLRFYDEKFWLNLLELNELQMPEWSFKEFLSMIPSSIFTRLLFHKRACAVESLAWKRSCDTMTSGKSQGDVRNTSLRSINLLELLKSKKCDDSIPWELKLTDCIFLASDPGVALRAKTLKWLLTLESSSICDALVAHWHR